MTPKTGLKNNYAAKTPVSASDLNRRADLFDAQTYGALDGVGLGIIQNGAATSLKVTGASGAYSVAPGSAIVLSDGASGFEPHSVFGKLTIATAVVANEDAPYIHAGLLTATSVTAPSTECGTAQLQIFASDDEEIPGALLLAEWQEGGGLLDRRVFIKADQALLQLSQMAADLGYDATARAKGTVAQRLDAILGTGDEEAPTGEVTRIEFNTKIGTLTDALNAQAAVVAALQEKLGLPGVTTATDGVDRYLNRDVARLEVEASIQDRPFSLEIDASVAVPGVVGNGDDLGEGLTSRDVHSGTTVWDEEVGEER